MSKVDRRINKELQNDECSFYLQICEWPDGEDGEIKPDIRIHYHGGLAHFGYEFESKDQLEEIVDYLNQVKERWS